MGYHTFDASRADELERAGRRYRFLSAEELCWALDPSPADVVVHLGSGTGFYTDDVAPHVGVVLAVDRQRAMHDYYRRNGVPANVELVTGSIDALPYDRDAVDAAVSTMTYHEFASEAALEAIHRVLAPAGRFVLVDWAATGTGDDGPPLAERFTATDAADALRAADFRIEHQAVRPETYLLVARA